MGALQANFTILGICMCSHIITILEKSETLDSLPHDFAQTGLYRRHFPRGGFREGAQEARPPPIPLPRRIYSGIAHK